MNPFDAILRCNLEAVQARIAAACDRAGRPRSDVTLVAITKYVGPETVRRLHQLGIAILGESRPQELWRKAAAVPEAVWHLVGHLQRNKVRQTLPLVQLIHSVDSLRLLEAIETEASSPTPVLLEFNLSSEPAKHGFAASHTEAILTALTCLKHVEVHGLMTMAALDAAEAEIRKTFADLRTLRRQLRQSAIPPHTFKHLSMGMTNDFELAIEEGATLVRIGSALFEGWDPNMP